MSQISFYKNASVEEAAEAIATLQVVSRSQPSLTKSALDWSSVQQMWGGLPEDAKNALRGAGIGAGVGGLGGAIAGLTDRTSPNRNVLRNMMLGGLLGGGAGAGVGVGIGRMRNAGTGTGAGGAPTAAGMQATIDKGKNLLSDLRSSGMGPAQQDAAARNFAMAHGLQGINSVQELEAQFYPSGGVATSGIEQRAGDAANWAVDNAQKVVNPSGLSLPVAGTIGAADAAWSRRNFNLWNQMNQQYGQARSKVDDLLAGITRAEEAAAGVATGPEAQALAAAKNNLTSASGLADTAGVASKVPGLDDLERIARGEASADAVYNKGQAATGASQAEQAMLAAKAQADQGVATARTAHADAAAALGKIPKPLSYTEASKAIRDNNGGKFRGFGFGGFGRFTGEVPFYAKRKYMYAAPFAMGAGKEVYDWATKARQSVQDQAMKGVQPYLGSAPGGN